jgi:hypothetical protein
VVAARRVHIKGRWDRLLCHLSEGYTFNSQALACGTNESEGTTNSWLRSCRVDPTVGQEDLESVSCSLLFGDFVLAGREGGYV